MLIVLGKIRFSQERFTNFIKYHLWFHTVSVTKVGLVRKKFYLFIIPFLSPFYKYVTILIS